jgi:glycosyltransferase involved in cell wall biosynthesis
MNDYHKVTNSVYFIYTGNAYPHKNLKRLIEAIVLLNKNKSKKITLKIISGRSEFAKRLAGEINNLNATGLVEVTDYVDDQKLSKLYKNSLAFVFPTLEEGFGLPPMEAIEAGTIAVVSDIPVLKEVYGDSVDYFDPHSVSSIITQLEKVILLSSPARIQKLKYAQEYIKKYSWREMAKETLKIYKSV